MDRVTDVVAPLELEPRRLEQLKTAVSEAAMNAIEHGNGSDPDIPVDVARAAQTAASCSSRSPTAAAAPSFPSRRRPTSKRSSTAGRRPAAGACS